MAHPVPFQEPPIYLVKLHRGTTHRSQLRGLILLAALLTQGLICSARCSAQTADTYRKRAVEFSRAKSWDQAVANYRQALALEPNDPLTHYDLALALKYSGHSEEAVPEFQDALRLKPNWPEAHFGLGAAYYDLQNTAAAADEFKAAVALDPSNVEAHRFLARVYSQQNNYVAAESELK
ncbi:MAG: tetratricopeptide repeat protein, partial [Candidatus Acidiferrales bacterium]